MRSLYYEYALNVLAILIFVEIAFRERFYQKSSEQINSWFAYCIVVNIFFLGTLVLDWVILGFKRSFQRHPRVATETITQLLLPVRVCTACSRVRSSAYRVSQ